jgi:hypothetical protein
MARLSLRTAFTALILGVAALGGSALASAPASAHSGGWGHHHGHGGWGFRPVRFVPVIYGGYGSGCVIKRIVTFDGSVIIKKRCF